jgi:hypothetical protein
MRGLFRNRLFRGRFLLVDSRTYFRLDALGDIHVDRTRVSFLLAVPQFRKDVKNHVRLHFQFTR